jgi:hypothetical protein
MRSRIASALALFALSSVGCSTMVADGGTGGGGAGGSTSVGNTSGTGTSTGGGGLSCASYCATMMQSCTNTNAEYISSDVCLAMCAFFDPGAPGDMTGDSLACRANHAEQTAVDPVTRCPAAGPVSGGSCAPACKSFCLLAYGMCEPIGLFPYQGGIAECVTACQGFPYLVGPNTGDLMFLSGDTLNCRIYHLEAAFDQTIPHATTTHCPHLGVDSPTCN